jgi:hypothetical protein
MTKRRVVILAAAFLAGLLFGTLMGCNSAKPLYDEAMQYRQWQAEKEAAEKAAVEAQEREQAEAEAKAKADAAAKEKARYEAALAPPHPAQYRDAANAAGHEYFLAGTQPPIVGPDNPKAYLMLWKTPAHSLRETVFLLGRSWLANPPARLVVAADPHGSNVIAEARIVAPYEGKHPAAYLPKLGQAYRPGPVFVVGFDAQGARLFVYLVPDPGTRTGALR